MRQKKSKSIYYIIAAAAVLAVFLFVAMLELPVKTEHVEEVIPNDFLTK